MAVRLRRGRLLAVLAAGTVPALLAGPATAATRTATFGCSGGEESWTVPAGITEVTFVVDGAAGGRNNFGSAGLGGRAEATVTVNPGFSYSIVVGCEGASISQGSGGFGFGRGGDGDAGGSQGTTAGGGGGGGSGVLLGTDVLLVGGGGGGSAPAGGPSNPTGGAGGGTTGADGIGGAAGGGGTQTGPGGGGGNGSPGVGHDGGSGAAGVDEGDGGGGGGGGWYGGGGGGSSDEGLAGGGGGGGSGFAAAGLAATLTAGVRAGDGQVTITYDLPNTAPTAVADSYATNEDTTLTVAAPGVLGNDSDPEDDPLSAVLVAGPSHGTVTLDADGSFTYTPAANYNGADSFTYKAGDGAANSNTATVPITVTAVNDAPTMTVAPGGSCGADDRSGTINLTLADPDTNAAGLSLSAISSNPALVPAGNVGFAGSGAGRTMTATAVASRRGSATITVTVTDGSTSSTVIVVVHAAGNGNDTVNGGAGTDILLGQNGDDTLNGQGGVDLLCGGRGNDRLTGGADADRFGGGPGNDVATDLSATEGDSQDGTIP